MWNTTIFFLILVLTFISVKGQDYKEYEKENRYALVVGNSNYPKEIGVLNNPLNDATDMAAALKAYNFEVELLTDATYIQIREAVRKFHEKLSSSPRDQTVGMFYYAGHGVQFQDENYLVPIDAKVQYEDDVVRMCFPVQRMILNNMERASSRMNIIILDACRNNPFPVTTRSLSGGGLGEIKKAYGSFIAYATAPGSVAADGAGRNGLYTQELLKAMQKPGLTIEQVFKEVRRSVLRLSGEKQYTWDSSNIIGDFYFIPPKPVATANAQPPEPVAPSEKQNQDNMPDDTTQQPSTPKMISDRQLEDELMKLTSSSIPFKQKQENVKSILRYFTVSYAFVSIMIGGRIDERITAEKLMDRLVTLPESVIKVIEQETADSGRIIELSVEIE